MLIATSFTGLSNTDTQPSLSEEMNIWTTFMMFDFFPSLLINSIAICNWLSHYFLGKTALTNFQKNILVYGIDEGGGSCETECLQGPSSV